MIKRIITIIIIISFFFGLPILAEEQLMTKHYFDNWLPVATAPLELQLQQLKTVLSEIDAAAKEISSYLTTEIKLIIGRLEAQIDGRTAKLDVAPTILNNRTMVPVRFIGEAFGAQFAWDEKTRKVTYTLGDLKIELYIDNKTASVNGRQVALEAPPYIVQGRTMVPLRFVGEYMEASFSWDSATRTVSIRK